jgi:hypothetical protein
VPITEISWGELRDRISILELKITHVNDADCRGRLVMELSCLNSIWNARLESLLTPDGILHPPMDDMLKAMVALDRCNSDLWTLENQIRRTLANDSADFTIASIARSIVQTNDARCKCKRRIDELFQYGHGEIKCYNDVLE